MVAVIPPAARPPKLHWVLYPKYLDASVLRGKSYPEAPAQELLEAGKPLTPETCGLQYVDGLTSRPSGSHRIAVFWDKFGSGHNSEALPFSGHTVMFMDGHTEIIATDDWPSFLADQQPAWAAIRRGASPSPAWIRNRPAWMGSEP